MKETLGVWVIVPREAQTPVNIAGQRVFFTAISVERYKQDDPLLDTWVIRPATLTMEVE